MGGTQCFKTKSKESNAVIKSNPVPPRKFSFGDSQVEIKQPPQIKSGNIKKQSKYLKQYKIIKLCGLGYYSKVYLCTNEKDPNTFYAVKTLKKKNINDSKSISHILTEEKYLQNISSPYIINIIESFEINSRKYYVYPYYNLDLFNLIKLTNKNLPEIIIKNILSQIYCAISYLHSKKILYRDLKPENIIIDVDTGFVKLIDFGLAAYIENESIELNEICGTNEYIPPEVIGGIGYNYDFDYWTFGILTYELIYGHPPFKGNNQKEVFNNILSHQITFDDSQNKKISDEVKDLLKYMLKKDREERMEWVNIPYHPFFKGVVFDYKNSKVSNNYQSSKIIQTFVEKYRDYSAFVVDK